MMTSGNHSSDGDRIEARSPTDQRDTPDTRPGCTCYDPGAAGGYHYERDVFCPRHGDTPDTRTPSAEGCGHDYHQWERTADGQPLHRWGHIAGDLGPAPWEPCPGQGSWMPDQPASYRASDQPTLSDAPSAPNRAPTDEARCASDHIKHRDHLGERQGICAGEPFPAKWEPCSEPDPSAAPTEGGISEAPSSRRASDQRPMLSTADRDALTPGDIIVHRPTGDARTILSRKETDDGWWLLDGSGIADRVLRNDWVSVRDLTRENERLRAELAQMTAYRDNAVGNRRGADAEVDSLRDDLADLRRQAEQSQEQVTGLQRALDETNALVAAVRQECARDDADSPIDLRGRVLAALGTASEEVTDGPE